MILSKAISGFVLDAATRYSPATLPGMKSNLKLFLDHFGDVELTSITTDKLQKYFQWLRQDYKPRRMSNEPGPLSGSAVDNHWKTQRVFWRWCAEIFEINNPAEKLMRAKFIMPDVHPFKPDEVKKLLEACKLSPLVLIDGRKPYRIKLPHADRDTAIILMLLDTGLRIGEFCRLKVGDVDLESGEVSVRPFRDSSKSRPRIVYIGTRAKRAIWKYIAKQQAEMRADDKLFGLTESSIRHTLTHIGEKANVADVHPHRFRHTAAIAFIRAGGNAFALMRMLGHSDMTMTRRYLELAQADDKEAHRIASPVDNWKLA